MKIGMSQSDLGSRRTVVTSDIQATSRAGGPLSRDFWASSSWAGEIHRLGFQQQSRFRVDGTLHSPSVIGNAGTSTTTATVRGGVMGGRAHRSVSRLVRAALGVAGMRYSLLLPRSVDFDQFARCFTRPIHELTRRCPCR